MADENKGQAAAAPGLGEILIEIGTGKNDAVLWGPTQDRLRGSFDAHNFPLGDTSSVGMMSFPPFPGMHVLIDCRGKRAMIFDPLSQKEMEALLSKVSDVHKSIFRVAVTGCPPVTRDVMDDDEVATWVYAAWRAVKAGQARVVRGVLPETERDILRGFPKGTRYKRNFYGTMDVPESVWVGGVR